MIYTKETFKSEYNLTLNYLSITPPLAKTTYIEIPGASKPLDLTEYFGEVFYGWVSEDDLTDELPDPMKEEIFRFPTPYIAITTYFSSSHRGIDLAWNASKGFNSDMDIMAAMPGTVMRADWFGGAGNTVWVRYDDEDNNCSWWALYKHLSAISVSVGQTLEIGQKVGNMGNTGFESRGAHLHFDLVKCPYGYNYSQGSSERAKYSVNPLDYLRKRDTDELSYDDNATRGVA